MQKRTCKVNILDVKHDLKYQREVRKSHVKKMADNWQPEIAGFVVVSKRSDGTLALVDGGHRQAATRMRIESGDTDIDTMFDALEYSGLTLQEEADMYLKFNGQRANASPIEKYKGGVLGKDPDHLTVASAAKIAGFTIGSTVSKDTVSCVGGLLSMAQKLGSNRIEAEILIVEALRAAKALAKNNMPKAAYRREIVEGLGLFLDRAMSDSQFSADRLAKVLSKADATEIMVAARSRAVGSNRVSNWVAQVIHELYNSGLSSKKLAEWSDLDRRSARRVD